MISTVGGLLSPGIGMVVVVTCGFVVAEEGFVVDVVDVDDVVEVDADDRVSVGVLDSVAPALAVVVVSSDAVDDSTANGAVEVVVSLAPDVQAARTSDTTSTTNRIGREGISGIRSERTCC